MTDGNFDVYLIDYLF